MSRTLVIAIALLSSITAVDGQTVQYPDPTQRVLTHREQNALVTPWIKKRFDTLLGPLMTREGIDMWIIPTREYNEDPVFPSMSPLTYFASRRRTILVFYNPGGGKAVERYSIGRFDYDGLYTMVPTPNDGQHAGLRKLVDEKNPKVIGINESDSWNHADGITATRCSSAWLHCATSRQSSSAFWPASEPSYASRIFLYMAAPPKTCPGDMPRRS